jgi:large subunit ribosomal protein L19
MTQELMNKAVAKSLKATLPQFNIGDTVSVSVRIVEGDKERLQDFNGTVIGRRGGGVTSNFTVRRIVNNEGVERTFPINSPRMAGVKVVRSGRVRRAKLYYLRDRVGKSVRIRDAETAVPTTEAGIARAAAKAAAKVAAQAATAPKA